VTAELRIRQVRSSNRSNPKQRDTLRSLKLGGIGREVSRADSPQLRGMLRVVGHLVEVVPDKEASDRQQAEEGG
jgi:large subunit ribosomal protein L30